MTEIEPKPRSEELYERPSALHFDRRNPRTLDHHLPDDNSVLRFLVEWFDVGELVLAIAHSGWFDYEPLIVLNDGNVVLEGNRRLAALRILAEPDLGRALHVQVPNEIIPAAQPELVRIRRVHSRSEARAFIGFKHVNGAFKWDALAKAGFAAAWHEDDPDIEAIARRLGDTHNTVVRLVNGWNVLEQSKRLGFDMEQRTRKRFALSHLYTALSRPTVRDYLGLSDVPAASALSRDPVPHSHRQQLLSFMSWLYGQHDQPTVIGSQNPDLNRLVAVLGDSAATALLEETRDLAKAYGETENKSALFARSLMLGTRHTEEASRLLGHYKGQRDLLRAAGSLRKTAVRLDASMRQAAMGEESRDAD